MTDEEYQAKVAEYNRLVNEYNYLVEENVRLEAEVELAVQNCYIVAENISKTDEPVTHKVKYLADNLEEEGGIVDELYQKIIDITENYFLFKNLSTASKNLTQYNDIYSTKFKFYNELRRIALGYVIGIDSHIISSETMRKKVEKAYLANTDYWLAYAISAVMLWASNEKEAAYRALNKSLKMDKYRSCVFFMLVNLRFQRTETARSWFLTFLGETDVNKIPEEWQHILNLYLTGGLNTDAEIQKTAEKYFNTMLEQTKATSVDFSKKAADRSYEYVKTYIHSTDTEYPDFRSFCPEYDNVKYLLSQSEKVQLMIKYYSDVYEMQETHAGDMKEHIENVLYNLIDAYDTEEFKIIKEIRRNEEIMAAKGDTKAAEEKFQSVYGHMYETHTFGDLMIYWAFSDDYKAVDITVKKFSVGKLKEQIDRGIQRYFEECRNMMKERYPINVMISRNMQPLRLECSENEREICENKIEQHYEKNRVHFILGDSIIKIFLFICAGAILLLGIAALSVKSDNFAVFLTLGAAAGIIGGFLTWKQWTELTNRHKEQCRIAIVKFRSVLDEMADWRRKIQANYEHTDDISYIIGKF
ncbi:MAG: hypothetical protein IJ666_08055 [Ruminococcus sp.]|nr:hypothetical protein [Ruminococcus sp.]